MLQTDRYHQEDDDLSTVMCTIICTVMHILGTRNVLGRPTNQLVIGKGNVVFNSRPSQREIDGGVTCTCVTGV